MRLLVPVSGLGPGSLPLAVLTLGGLPLLFFGCWTGCALSFLDSQLLSPKESTFRWPMEPLVLDREPSSQAQLGPERMIEFGSHVVAFCSDCMEAEFVTNSSDCDN